MQTKPKMQRRRTAISLTPSRLIFLIGEDDTRRNGFQGSETMSVMGMFRQLTKRVVASDEIKQQILKTGIRRIERETRVSHHTINRILKGENVRRKTLAKIVKQTSVLRTVKTATA